MKKLVALSFIITSALSVSFAQAESVPSGCYVTDSERYAIRNVFGYTPVCYRAADSYYSWFTHNQYGRTEMSLYYGSFVEAVMYADHQDVVACTSAHNSLLDEKNSLKTSYDSLSGQYNGAVAAYNSMSSSFNSAVAREKKLRKACGKKCKKIK